MDVQVLYYFIVQYKDRFGHVTGFPIPIVYEVMLWCGVSGLLHQQESASPSPPHTYSNYQLLAVVLLSD